jgi:hypothetical protein
LAETWYVTVVISPFATPATVASTAKTANIAQFLSFFATIVCLPEIDRRSPTSQAVLSKHAFRRCIFGVAPPDLGSAKCLRLLYTVADGIQTKFFAGLLSPAALQVTLKPTGRVEIELNSDCLNGSERGKDDHAQPG